MTASLSGLSPSTSTKTDRKAPVSVIIPVRNGAHYLRQSLPPLRAALPAGWEIIVVDDHSTDDSAQVAGQFADLVITSRSRHSAPAARNSGALEAAGDILVFLDQDIRVTRDALEQLVAALDRPQVVCTFTIYSEGRYLRTLGGRFKNVWVRHTYLESPANPRWMNTAMTAIRTSDFWKVGGYDSQDDWVRGGNDIEFGRVVAEKLGRVILLRDVDCDHLKEMSLPGLLKNDYNRTRGFFRLSLESREIKRVAGGNWFGNIPPSFMGGVIAAPAVALGLLMTPLFPVPGLWIAGTALFAHTILGLGFYRYAMPRIGGWAPLVPFVLLIDHMACFAGLVSETLAFAGRAFRPAGMASRAPEAASSADVPPGTP